MNSSDHDPLEDFIRQNRDDFDHREPSPEIWDRIATHQKLVSVDKSSPSKITYLWRAAAVLALVASSIAIWLELQPNGPTELASMQVDSSQVKVAKVNEQVQDGEVSELLEAEAFYAGQVNTMLAEVSQYTSSNPEIRDEVAYNMAELDSAYVELKRDLNDDMANEEVVEAMIQNYRLKLRILEDILDQLKQVKSNQYTHENNRNTSA